MFSARREDGAEARVFREGENWWWSGWGGGSYFKLARASHLPTLIVVIVVSSCKIVRPAHVVSIA